MSPFLFNPPPPKKRRVILFFNLPFSLWQMQSWNKGWNFQSLELFNASRRYYKNINCDIIFHCLNHRNYECSFRFVWRETVNLKKYGKFPLFNFCFKEKPVIFIWIQVKNICYCIALSRGNRNYEIDFFFNWRLSNLLKVRSQQP